MSPRNLKRLSTIGEKNTSFLFLWGLYFHCILELLNMIYL